MAISRPTASTIVKKENGNAQLRRLAITHVAPTPAAAVIIKMPIFLIPDVPNAATVSNTPIKYGTTLPRKFFSGESWHAYFSLNLRAFSSRSSSNFSRGWPTPCSYTSRTASSAISRSRGP